MHSQVSISRGTFRPLQDASWAVLGMLVGVVGAFVLPCCVWTYVCAVQQEECHIM